MKCLVIDLGNTNKKIALFDDLNLIAVEQHSGFDQEILNGFISRNPGAGYCILSSVVSFPSGIREFLSENFFFVEMNELTPLPVTIRYQTRNSLGSDRIAAAVAGSARFPGHDVLIINAGTCITYDFINKEKEYLGGGISPGIGMRFRALHTFTGKLPLISCGDYPDSELTGDTTDGSIRSGVLNGTLAEVEGIGTRYRERWPELKIIVSGGDHKYFVKRLKISIFAHPNIVLSGLQQILSFNVHKA